MAAPAARAAAGAYLSVPIDTSTAGYAVDWDVSWPTVDVRSQSGQAWQGGHRVMRPWIVVDVRADVTEGAGQEAWLPIGRCAAAVTLTAAEGVTAAQWEEARQHFRVAFDPAVAKLMYEIVP